MKKTTVELAHLGGMLEKLQGCRNASSIPSGRKICVSNNIVEGMIRGRSLRWDGDINGKKENCIWVSEW